MKNKEKFDLRKINWYDIYDKKTDTKTLKISSNGILVGKMVFKDSISDALMTWLEKDYKELPKEEQVVIKKEKEKIVLPEIPNVNKVLKKRGRPKKNS